MNHFRYKRYTDAAVDMSDADLAEQLVAHKHSYEALQPETDFIKHELSMFKGKAVVLDFGCGVGRNSVGLRDHDEDWVVVGYDSRAMLDRSKGYITDNTRILSVSDWGLLKRQEFDFVLAWTVFQHIEADEIDQYARDLLPMTPYLCLFGRWWADDTTPPTKSINVFSIFERYWNLDNDVDTTNVSGEDHLYARYVPK